jgi:hypothetical protein
VPESWIYYVPFVMQAEGKTAFSAKIVETNHRIDSPEAVIQLINDLTAEFYPGEPEEGSLPIMPLGWTLIVARQGAAVESPTAKPKGKKRASPTKH